MDFTLYKINCYYYYYQCWMIIVLLYGPQIVMYYLYAYDTVESGIKQLN